MRRNMTRSGRNHLFNALVMLGAGLEGVGLEWA